MTYQYQPLTEPVFIPMPIWFQPPPVVIHIVYAAVPYGEMGGTSVP